MSTRMTSAIDSTSATHSSRITSRTKSAHHKREREPTWAQLSKDMKKGDKWIADAESKAAKKLKNVKAVTKTDAGVVTGTRPPIKKSKVSTVISL